MRRAPSRLRGWVSLRERLFATVEGRFFLLISLGLVYFFTYEHTKWRYDPNGLRVPVELIPVPRVAWYTGAWLLLAGLVWAVGSIKGAPRAASSDRLMRRAAIVSVAVVYGWQAWERLTSIGVYGLERSAHAQLLMIPVVVGILGLLALVRWPPATLWLAALMMAGGTIARVLFIVAVGVNENYSDNLSVAAAGVDRMLAGATPYATIDFGTHTNPMNFLPWTLLSYAPPRLIGLDVRATNIILSLVLVLGLWLFFNRLTLDQGMRSGLLLALGVYYVLPRTIGHDAFTEFAMFNVCATGTFCLLALGREKLCAAAYGLALGSVLLASFFAPALVAYAVHRRPPRTMLGRALITACVAGLPVVIFLMWDAGAFVSSMTSIPTEAWSNVERARETLDFQALDYAVWHALLGGSLRFVQAFVAALVVAASARWVRTPASCVVAAMGSYLALVLVGPLVEAHMLQVILYLALVAAALLSESAVTDPATIAMATAKSEVSEC